MRRSIEIVKEYYRSVSTYVSVDKAQVWCRSVSFQSHLEKKNEYFSMRVPPKKFQKLRLFENV